MNVEPDEVCDFSFFYTLCGIGINIKQKSEPYSGHIFTYWGKDGKGRLVGLLPKGVMCRANA